MIRASYDGNQTNGIFAKLSEKGLISNDIFEPTVSSCLVGSSYIPLGITKTSPDDIWRSDKNAGNYLSIEFKKSKVIVDSFSIRGAVSGDCMLSFVVEGSNDNFSTKSIIYEQSNLNILDKGVTLTLASKCHSKFKYIKMRSTGVNGWNTHQIVLYIFELFGTLILDNYKKNISYCKRTHSALTFIVFMIIIMN